MLEKKSSWSLLLFVLVLAGIGGRASAQELEPRSFNNVPIGATFLVLAAGRSEGDLAPTPNAVLEDAELTIDVGALALSHAFALAGDSAKIDFSTTRVCYEGSGTLFGVFTEGRRCEYGDPKFKLTWNFYGAPALKRSEFRQWKQDLVIGASLGVSVPVGTYNSEHLINAGANRWAAKPTLGMSKRMSGWQWEAKVSATLFEDNDDFFNGIHVEQDPLYTISAHFIYLLKRGSWVSLDANYFTGGETTKDGVKAGDRQDNSRWGITWTKPINRKHLIKLFVSTGVVTRVGNDFNNFGLGYLYQF